MAKKDPYIAFRNVEFRYFLAMRLCGVLAIQMQAVIVGWQVYALSGKSELALGMIGLTEALPSILIALYAGHVADSMSRRTIILRAFGLLVLGAGILWFCSLEAATSIFPSVIVPVFFVIFLTGLARGFLSPALFAFLTQISNGSKDETQNAIAWNSTNWQIAAVAGPALGGLLYGYANVSVAYAVQFVLMVIALWCGTRIGAKPVPERVAGESMRTRIAAGLRFVFGTPIVLGAISLDLFAVLFGGAVALLPAFADKVLHVGPEGLGLLRAAQSLGSIPPAVWLAYHPVKRGAGRVLLACVAGFGVCMISFALSTWFWLSFVLLVASGAFDSVSVVIRSYILQNYTPEEMKGRVLAVNSIFVFSSNEIGAFESGVAARLMGLVPSVVFGGAMTLLVVFITALTAPKLRKLDIE